VTEVRTSNLFCSFETETLSETDIDSNSKDTGSKHFPQIFSAMV